MSTVVTNASEEQDSRHYYLNRLETVEQWRKNGTAYPHKFHVIHPFILLLY